MSNRLQNLRKLLQTKELSYILITDSIEAFYLCGVRSSNITLLVSNDSALLFTDFRYIELAQSTAAPLWDVQLLQDSLAQHLANYCSSSKTIGFQDTSMSVATFTKLTSELPFLKFIPLAAEITALFLTKSRTDITSISQAAAIADRSYGELIPQLRTGMSEFDVAALLDTLTRKNGSEKPSFDTIVLFGARSSLPHGEPSKEVFLTEGDWILIDFGCTINGFCSDMTRTALYGKATQKQKELYASVYRAQEIGREVAKAGITAQELDRVVRESLKKDGYTKEFGHGTGHGVGQRIHEAPAINTKTTTLLEPHMIITIEPGVYLPHFGGVRIEDLVEITPHGINLLSHTPRELIEIAPRP